MVWTVLAQRGEGQRHLPPWHWPWSRSRHGWHLTLRRSALVLGIAVYSSPRFSCPGGLVGAGPVGRLVPDAVPFLPGELVAG